MLMGFAAMQCAPEFPSTTNQQGALQRFFSFPLLQLERDVLSLHGLDGSCLDNNIRQSNRFVKKGCLINKPISHENYVFIDFTAFFDKLHASCKFRLLEWK
jgi:hypothetical protein